MKFNMEPSLHWLIQYLESTDPYDEIYLMLFSHGTNSIGLPAIDRWRDILGYGHQRGEFVGVVEDKYPKDFATLIRYFTDLKHKLKVLDRQSWCVEAR
jgi:hypothetical protein